MASKKEIDEYVKESGYTRRELGAFFKEAREVNWIIESFAKAGKKWSDLPIHQIKQLPGLKERTLENKAKDEENQKLRDEKVQKEADDKKYYEEHFVELMVKKIDNKEDLTEQEISKLLDSVAEVSKDYGDKDDWTIPVSTVIEIDGRYFMVHWNEALTESQESNFMYQPYEVKKHEYEKTIIVTEWQKI